MNSTKAVDKKTAAAAKKAAAKKTAGGGDGDATGGGGGAPKRVSKAKPAFERSFLAVVEQVKALPFSKDLRLEKQAVAIFYQNAGDVASQRKPPQRPRLPSPLCVCVVSAFAVAITRAGVEVTDDFYLGHITSVAIAHVWVRAHGPLSP